MCTVCGCGTDEHEHNHEAEHSHAHGMDSGKIIQIEKDILAKNNEYAVTNRSWFNKNEILALNLVSSPGSGKTTLLAKTISDLKSEIDITVVEGDQQTANDAERIKQAGAKAVQINTGKGCHLDAHMVGHALQTLNPKPKSIVFIENVGNLICPAAFDLGEACKVAILSVTEGEDKPLKYPDIFHASDLIILNKIDLLPYLDFDLEKCEEYIKRVNPKAKLITLSATNGARMDSWYEWIKAYRNLALVA